MKNERTLRTLLLGLDAFDPTRFEQLTEQGKLPNLARYVEGQGYAQFTVANPPQSEVSWTSIATGLNPGGHGMFDFVHRDPATYNLHVSLLPTRRMVGGTQFVPPYTARTIFDQAVDQGYPATVLWWPATFPARPASPVRTVPGLGTPDIQGRLGVGMLFAADPESEQTDRKTLVAPLTPQGKDRYRGQLQGPARKRRGGQEHATLAFQLTVRHDAVHLQIDRQSIALTEGRWSPIVELTFRLGLFVRLRVLTRVIVTQMQPTLKLYFLPLQLHPLHSPWRFGTPRTFLKELWRDCGPFLTLGWPQDTTGLEDGCITDSQFLALCDDIFARREHILLHQLQCFDEGVLAAVFDTLDRVQHMFWRDRPDIVEQWYQKLDALVGKASARLAGSGHAPAKVLVVSDHGFAKFDYKVHLNRWLLDHGYLATQAENAAFTPADQSLRSAAWHQSQAYAVGLNSVYLNLAGREGQGTVQPNEVDAVTERLCTALQQWQGPDGRGVVQQVWRREAVFEGPYAAYGPDLVIGYAPGYRGSAQTGLGQWTAQSIEPNYDHWGADHCIDPQAVPGVIFANQDLGNFPHPSYRDMPALTIDAAIQPGRAAAPPPTYNNDEEEAIVEERLKSLGYL